MVIVFLLFLELFLLDPKWEISNFKNDDAYRKKK